MVASDQHQRDRPGKGRGSAENLLHQLRIELRYEGDARLTIYEDSAAMDTYPETTEPRPARRPAGVWCVHGGNTKRDLITALAWNR
jgi:hypothetical protein